MSEKIVVRHMGPGDIPFGMALKDIAGWNQLPLDWVRFLEFEPQGCFVAQRDSTPAGTGTTIAYEKLFGWVGMILVHPSLRRRGIGRQILMTCIEYLESLDVQAVKLDATPLGKKLYDTIGFRDEYGLQRWVGFGNPNASLRLDLRELGACDLNQVVAFDTPIFGANRKRVLRRMLAETTVRAAGAFAQDGSLTGYVAVRPGQNAIYIGPLVATNEVAGRGLWDWSQKLAGPNPVYVDVLSANAAAVEFVRTSGFQVQRDLIRMYRGDNVSPGQPAKQYAIFGPEIG